MKTYILRATRPVDLSVSATLRRVADKAEKIFLGLDSQGVALGYYRSPRWGWAAGVK